MIKQLKGLKTQSTFKQIDPHLFFKKKEQQVTCKRQKKTNIKKKLEQKKCRLTIAGEHNSQIVVRNRSQSTSTRGNR